MNVLVFCEESQAVTLAFRAKGHNAYSADLQSCTGGHPEYHIKGDGLYLLNGYCTFTTQDGMNHSDLSNCSWDLLIAHPPCTYLSKAGACNLFNGDHSIKDYERLKKGFEARHFFMKCYNAPVDKICIENPVPMNIFKLPIHQQAIEPFEFGDPYTKRTYLWLKNLPRLEPSHTKDLFCNVESWTLLHSNAKIRSKTFQGIASAMAECFDDNFKPFQISINI